MATRLFATPPQFAQAPAYIRQDMPVYKLRSACYFQNRFIEGGTVISAQEGVEPNIEMFPLNQKAYDKVITFLTAYDKGGASWSAKMNRAYVKKLPAFLTEWKHLNDLAAQKGISLERAAALPVPVLVKPPEPAMFSVVDMAVAPQIPIEIAAPVKAPREELVAEG